MNVIEQIEYTHKWELETREAHHIKTLNASLNCVIPGRTDAEYYQDNREEIAEQHKQYHQANRARMLERQKQYQKEHKEEIAEYHKQWYQDNKQKIECDCGIQIGRISLKRHQRTKRHHETFSRKVYDFIHS
jgi:hypothetical protein